MCKEKQTRVSALYWKHLISIEKLKCAPSKSESISEALTCVYAVKWGGIFSCSAVHLSPLMSSSLGCVDLYVYLTAVCVEFSATLKAKYRAVFLKHQDLFSCQHPLHNTYKAVIYRKLFVFVAQPISRYLQLHRPHTCKFKKNNLWLFFFLQSRELVTLTTAEDL